MKSFFEEWLKAPRGAKRVDCGNRFVMNARTNIEKRLPDRAGLNGAGAGSTNAALHLLIFADNLFHAAEIFKKTSCAAGLKPGGRYVAKDMFEIGVLPLSMKRLPNQDRTIVGIDADIGTLNVKLTDVETAERETKWKARETYHTSGVRWKFAQQIGPVVDGAVTHPGGAHEKQYYADV